MRVRFSLPSLRSRSHCLPRQPRHRPSERLYIMDCGHNAATDQARWSPGVNVGKPIELSDNCYLIKHGAQWLLWDTGYPDAVADKPVTSPIGTATRPKRLADQLAEIKRQAGRHHLGRGLAHPWRPCRQRRHVPGLDAADPEGRGRLGVRRRQAGAVQEGSADQAAERRPRRVRRRQRRHPVDAGPYAGASVAARAPGEDRLRRADRRPRALQGQLGQRPRAVDEHQRRPDARLARQGREGAGRQEGPALDQPRQADQRRRRSTHRNSTTERAQRRRRARRTRRAPRAGGRAAAKFRARSVHGLRSTLEPVRRGQAGHRPGPEASPLRGDRRDRSAPSSTGPPAGEAASCRVFIRALAPGAWQPVRSRA